jgi:predicted ATPase
VELCRRLAGNPLGIEIAAARVNLLGLSGLIAAMDAGHCLSLVGHRTRVARHWTLRATLDWSYSLLSPMEQSLFRRLGVFGGSFDLEAAAGISSDERPVETGVVFEGLLSLTSKSMLTHEQIGDRMRYRLHETSRTYALDKLRECGEVASLRRHIVLPWFHGGMEVISSQPQDGIGWPTGGRSAPFTPLNLPGFGIG